MGSSFQHCLKQNLARYHEGRTARAAQDPRMQYLDYHISGTRLGALWDAIVERSSEPGLQPFRDMQIMFGFKNLKALTKYPRPGRCVSAFLEEFRGYMDLDFIFTDDLYFDLAVERTPERPTSSRTYLWRRCCLRQIAATHFGKGPRGGNSTSTKIYHHAFLRDACNMTNTFGPGHPFHSIGVRYAQFYSPVKAVLDAAKRYPFATEELEELGLDPRFRSAIQVAGRSRRDLQVLWSNYGHCKTRLSTSINDSELKTYGVRTEVRMTYRLLSDLFEHDVPEADSDGSDEEGSSSHNSRSSTRPPSVFAAFVPSRRERALTAVPHPPCVWTLKTKRFLRLVRHNANKCCHAFEVIVSLTGMNQSVPLSTTKLSIALLQTLRFSPIAGDYQTSRGHWFSERRLRGRDGQRRETSLLRVGLGFEQTMEEFGYCWWLPRVDWRRLSISLSFAESILFHNRTLINAHVERHQQVVSLEDANETLQRYGRWLRQYGQHAENRRDLFYLMAHRLLQQYRNDVEYVIRDGKPQQGKPVQNFSWQGLRDVAPAAEVAPVNGLRTQKRRPLEVFELLWGDVDRDTPLPQHLHFHTTGWRVMYRQVRANIRATLEPKALTEFEQLLFTELATYHWVYPWPERSNGNLGQRTKTKPSLRLIYLLRRGVPLTAKEYERLPDGKVFPWRWGRDSPEPGLTPSLPTWLDRSTDDWRATFRRRLRMYMTATEPSSRRI